LEKPHGIAVSVENVGLFDLSKLRVTLKDLQQYRAKLGALTRSDHTAFDLIRGAELKTGKEISAWLVLASTSKEVLSFQSDSSEAVPDPLCREGTWCATVSVHTGETEVASRQIWFSWTPGSNPKVVAQII